MKRKALAIVLTLLMLVSVLPMGAFAASYTDTEGHWAEKSIDRWTDAKVLEGMGNNTYAPDENLTRAQAMTIFSRLLKLTEKGDISKLTDVAADAWYAPYIETGYAYEIIKGTSDTTFDPTGEITREQFFSIFARAVGMNLGAEKATSSNKDFTDLDSISDWAKEEGAVYAMINAGYVNGYPDGSLKPLRNITRAEVAKILDNAISDYITENGTYDLTGHKGIVIVTAPNVKLTGDFNGLIVSSCPDSTLDLSSIKGKPHVHILGDNTKIINAPVGTRITISPAADNVTVNNKKYNPKADFIVGASSSTGGGGGGSSTPTSTVTLTASTPFGTFILKATDAKDVSDALTQLASDKDSVKAVVEKALTQLKDKDTTVGGFEVKVDAAGVITVTGAGADLDGHMKALREEFNKHMDSAAAALGIAADNADWAKLVAAFDPYSMFKDYSANSMTYLDADAYAQKVVDVLNALNGLDTTVPEFASKLETVIANGHAKYGLDWSGVTYAAGAKAIEDGKLVAGTAAKVSATLVKDDASSFSNAVQDLVGLDITGYPDIMAIVGAGVKEARVCGDYTMSVVVE